MVVAHVKYNSYMIAAHMEREWEEDRWAREMVLKVRKECGWQEKQLLRVMQMYLDESVYSFIAMCEFDSKASSLEIKGP